MNLTLLILLIVSCFWFTYTDLRYREIPNKITHWAILVLLFVRIPSPEFYAGLIPAAVLLMIWFFSPSSLGAGDVKLFAMIGLCMGIEETFTVLFWTLAFFCISVLSIRIMRRRRVDSLPLAPMITGSILFTLSLGWLSYFV
ncbi:prepilin peptidase [Paenibacillus amylolyticus]|uniref:prepilin peptidase n=1 Tax=Paenibacillus amylolyticus TaxID=1451 RepID=UPI003BB0FDFD